MTLKALYGLKQAPRLWYKRFSNFFLKKLGFQQINVDYNIFKSAVEINGPIMSTFVDDIKIIRVKNFRVINQVKEKLITIFKMVDMRPISFYFSFEVS